MYIHYMTMHLVLVALLKKILKKTPSKRYTVGEIKDHIWYKK